MDCFIRLITENNRFMNTMYGNQKKYSKKAGAWIYFLGEMGGCINGRKK